MGEFGFFLLGVGMGGALVLSVWQWVVGREKTELPTDVFTDYHKEYYTPLVDTTVVGDAVVSRVTKSRSKRIRSRKKPVSKKTKARRVK